MRDRKRKIVKVNKKFWPVSQTLLTSARAIQKTLCGKEKLVGFTRSSDHPRCSQSGLQGRLLNGEIATYAFPDVHWIL